MIISLNSDKEKTQLLLDKKSLNILKYSSGDMRVKENVQTHTLRKLGLLCMEKGFVPPLTMETLNNRDLIMTKRYLEIRQDEIIIFMRV